MKISDLFIFAFQIGLRYEEARNITMWELNMQAEAQKRNDHKMINLLRNHASIVISPYAKKGSSINPRKIWPIEGEYIPKATDKESYQKSLEFFRNRNWKVKRVMK